MPPSTEIDAVVVGSGPNGLAAAVALARTGLQVRVYEGAPTIGGGTRTEALTLPGFRHDVCSAVHPLAAGSPFFRALPLERHGLRWIDPPIALAHPLLDGSAAVLTHDIGETARSLGDDAQRYRRIVGALAGRWDELAADALRPVTSTLPRHPLLLARFGLRGAPPLALLARGFHGERARMLLAAMAGHTIAPLSTPASGGVAMLFALAAHAHGWPVAEGGSHAITDALAAYLQQLGSEIVTAHAVEHVDELPRARAYLFDVVPRDLLRIAGDRFSERYTARLRRFRHGPGVYKLDYALDGPVPWRAEPCRRAGTVHVAASYAEVRQALHAVSTGRLPDPPLLICAQPSLFDATRAPQGRHTFWVYAHVPNGYDGDFTGAVERQLERFAPGFRDRVLQRSVLAPRALQERNPNLAGGDIGGGAFTGLQTMLRPVTGMVPYATSDPAIFLCSSSTPPGGGVHGMCGWHAARVVLRHVFGQHPPLSPT